MPKPKRPAPPDQIIREIPLIARYARHNENADYSFRAYMKGELPLSNEELDASVKEITDEVWAQIDCTTCGNCCRSLQVEVNETDIKRLAARFEITPQEFRTRYVKQAKEGYLHFASPPCPFLSDNNLCTVYEDRPDTCRDYPFLHQPNFRSRSLLMIETTAICPIVFNVWQRVKHRFSRRR